MEGLIAVQMAAAGKWAWPLDLVLCSQVAAQISFVQWRIPRGGPQLQGRISRHSTDFHAHSFQNPLGGKVNVQHSQQGSGVPAPVAYGCLPSALSKPDFYLRLQSELAAFPC